MQYKDWTIEILARTENGRAFLVDVRATKGAETKDRQFDGIVSIAGLKSAVINWIDNDDLKATLPSSGTLDFTEPTPEVVEPTAAELAKTAWDLDVARIKVAQELLDCGVVLSAGQLSALATLRQRVATNFRAEYLG